MLLTMFIGLFTSRIVLQSLGIEDYGIYNVIAGFVTMFSMLNFNLASQRFIAYALGKENKRLIQQIISSFNLLNVIIILIFLLIAETLGIWFLNNKLVFPASRANAVFLIYQFAVFSFVSLLYSSTYVSAIIAHEKMQAFAYLSVIESCLKLIVALLIFLCVHQDKLVMYAFLLFAAQLICQLFYLFYCKYCIGITLVSFRWNRKLMKEILSFSSWISLTGIVVMLSTQGLNILLNIFGGPILNAARGIAVQVQNIFQNFGSNFMQAVNPQMVKSYAMKDIDAVHRLFFLSSKMGFLLLLMLSLPFFFETKFLLILWLGKIPDYTVIFLRIILVWLLISILSSPCMMAVQATGRIRKYQSCEIFFLCIIFIASWFSLKRGLPPQSIFIISLIIECILLCVRLYIVLPLLSISFFSYIKEVIFKLLKVILPLISLVSLFHSYYNGTLLSLLTVSLSTVILTLTFTYCFTCSKSEKTIINTYIINALKRWNKK